MIWRGQQDVPKHLNKAYHHHQGGLVPRRPPQQGSNISSQNSHPNQLKRNAVIKRGNHSKLEKQAEAEQTLTRMVEKTWVGGFNTSNNTTNNTTELKPTQPSFRRNLHSPGFIQLNQILGSLVVND